MQKLKPNIYKGIEFINLKDLAAKERELIKNSSIELIKILIDGNIVEDCIQYKDYICFFGHKQTAVNHVGNVEKDREVLTLTNVL